MIALFPRSLHLLDGLPHKIAQNGRLYPPVLQGVFGRDLSGHGWLVLIAVKPLWLQVPNWGLFRLLAGGFAYTVGAALYAATSIRYSHFARHLFVFAGSVFDFLQCSGTRRKSWRLSKVLKRGRKQSKAGMALDPRPSIQ
jgi:hypothetical protein